MKDQREPVSREELVFRRIINKFDYFNPNLERPVSPAAFRPTNSDVDGISVYRPECGATPEAVADGPSQSGYYVAALQVAEILDIVIDGFSPTIIPSPSEIGPLGHASIPELNITLRDGNKSLYRRLAAELAKLITAADIVHSPA